MALETTDNRKEYAGNGVTTNFSFPYYFLGEEDLVVILRDNTTLAETLQVLTTNYTITGEGLEAGGTVVMNSAPAAGKTLVIYRNPEIIQDKDFRENDSFPAEQAEEAWDRAAMVSQRLAERVNRKIGVSDGAVIGDFNLDLPAEMFATGGAGRTFMVNDDEDGFELGPTGDDIENAQGYAADAAASADDAEDSADLAQEWATKTDDLVAATDNSAKAYAIGGTGAGQPTSGDAKSWAMKTSAAVITGLYSAKEWATGILTRGLAAGGSAKDWANLTGETVDDTEYSAKEHAQGSETRGTAGGGSAKDWANHTGSTVDDTEYSAKHYAQEAQLSVATGIGAAVRDLGFADSPITLAQSDQGKILQIDTSGGNVVVNLPSIAALTLSSPFMIGLKKNSTDTNTITVNINGTDRFDNGDSAKVIRAPGGGYFLVPSTVPTPDNWTAFEIGGSASAGGGGALQWVEASGNSPIPTEENNFKVYKFESGLAQKLYAMIKVPAGYLAGNQINMKMPYYSPDTSGTALLSTVATLLRSGTDAVTSTTNQRTSTNSALNLATAALANKLNTHTCDLTSSSGQINGVSVAAGDVILVELTRGTDTATSDLNALVYGAEVTFS